jgi:hypothetical protein
LRAWLDYLTGLLLPGGHLILTTRGRRFIDFIDRRRQHGNFSELVRSLPPPEEMRGRYERGEFQFYPTGGGGELTSDFYGETLIPRHYFETNYQSMLVQFTEEVQNVPQAIVVLKNQGNSP